jgi:hypothetical protein
MDKSIESRGLNLQLIIPRESISKYCKKQLIVFIDKLSHDMHVILYRGLQLEK